MKFNLVRGFVAGEPIGAVPGASEAVRQHRFDTAFLGACAADPVEGLTVATIQDAHVKRAAIASSKRVVLLATPEKFARTATFHVADLSRVDTVITTDAADADLVQELRFGGSEVIQVAVDETH